MASASCSPSVSPNAARDVSTRLVDAARRGDPSARSIRTLEQAKQRVDAIRARFDRFIAEERRLFAARQESADDDARQAIVVAMIALFGGCLTRATTLPIRRAARGELHVDSPDGGGTVIVARLPLPPA